MLTASRKAARTLVRLIAVAAMLFLSVLALSLTPHAADGDASALYVLESSGTVRAEYSGDVFVTDGDARLISRLRGSEQFLDAGTGVAIRCRGQYLTTVARGETVDELLSRLDICPSPLEMVSVAFSDSGAEVAIDSEFVFYETISSVTEHETVYQYRDDLPAWQETVLQEGSDGEYREVYEIVYQDGEETARQLIDQTDTEPVPTVIEKGTIENFAENGEPVASIAANGDGSGVITLENGETLTFRETRTMKGTAYTAGGGVGSRTASGTAVRVGVAAVDRSVLPLGSKMYVVSNDGKYVYGFAVAEDTGVRGNIIDLYMDSYSECIQFGVRDCTVYVLD